MYDDILFPYDGRDGAAEVLHHAAELAGAFDATVHLLFVAETASDTVTVVETQVVDGLVETGEETLERAEKRLRSLGVDYESEVVQGNPAPTIVDYAEHYDIDLIVMPTYGRDGLSRYLIGSVAEKVVRLASVPVLTTRMQPDEELTFPDEHVLLATDGSAGADRAVDHGLSLAAGLGATVHALSVVDDGTLAAVRFDDEADAAATEAVERLVSAAENRGVTDVVRRVERGSPFESIRDDIEANDVDPVVLGTTGRRGTERILLGSVAEKTVRSAPVPVITVGDGEQSD